MVARLSDDTLREAADLYLACGRNKTELAKRLDVNIKTATKRVKQAAERGFLLPDTNAEVPDGYKIKGTSSLYKTDEDGRVTKTIEWVKTQVDADRQEELAKIAVENLVKDVPPREPIETSGEHSDQLMTCYPVGDHHFGMLAWEQDAGGDYDLEIGEKLLCGAMDYLVDASPACENAAIVLLGDFLHYDSMKAETPTHGHHLDADSRPAKMIDVAMRSIEHLIRAALRKHSKVRLIISIGNHDLYSTLWLQRAFAMAYRNEPRLKVNKSPSNFHFLRHGKCLVGVHHGHRVKMQSLPLLMATDAKEDWGQTDYRYWWTGHVHHDQVKDYEGVRCESFRILPPADEHAHSSGYRSGRDMKAIVLHSEFGEVARYLVNPAMLDSGTTPDAIDWFPSRGEKKCKRKN